MRMRADAAAARGSLLVFVVVVAGAATRSPGWLLLACGAAVVCMLTVIARYTVRRRGPADAPGPTLTPPGK